MLSFAIPCPVSRDRKIKQIAIDQVETSKQIGSDKILSGDKIKGE